MNTERIHSLDGLRAVSIILVLIGHIAGTVNAPLWLTPLHNLGNFGVKIFFVISGFLITFLLLEELRLNGSISLRNFYMRRSFRIFPAFYFYIACMFVANRYGLVELFLGDIFHAASYTMNYHHERAWALNHTWSLAVEEQFYLLWPLALVMIGIKRSLLCAFIFVIIAPLIRAGMWYGLESTPSAMIREFQAVGDALAAGCLLAAIHHRGWKIPAWFNTKWFIAVPISLFIVPVFLYKLDPSLFYIIGQTYVNLVATAIIWRCTTISKGITFRFLNNAHIVWLGTLSYSLYLWQEPFLNSWSRDWFVSWPINLALAFGCAIISFYLVERPFLKIKQSLSSLKQPRSSAIRKNYISR
jgi:peptidoglycan/LPS O-acetylase OafA/YrhL